MLAGKVAIVTGSAQGLGRATAEELARRGASVVIADIDGAKAEETAAQLRENGFNAMGLRLDVTNSASVAEGFNSVVSKLGRIDILVNNAGIFARTPTVDFSEEQWDRVVDINLKSVFLCGRAAARVMIPQGGGKIINIASVAAHVAAPGGAAYAASKSGVVGLTRSLAVEWGASNIQVNSISPGSMGTEMSKAARKNHPEQYARRDRRIPSAVQGKPEDIANTVAFLASQAASFVNGRDIIVDGGILCCDPGFVE